MDDTNKRLCEFSMEVSNLLNDRETHKYFRYRTLLLIKKYFNYDKMMFTLYEDNLEIDTWKFNLDTISLGIEMNMVNEYYSKFHSMDPIGQWNGASKVVDLFSIIDETEFLKSKYYLKFFRKYNIRYEINSFMKIGNKKVGKISFLRSEIEERFNEADKYLIEKINEIVLIELLKAIQIKKLNLEVSVLKELSDSFPVGKIVLNDDYTINYYNKLSEKFICELTGARDINFFRYYFLNEILIEREGIDKTETFTVEIDGLWLKIIPFNDIVSKKNEKAKYIIFIVKNVLYEETKIAINYQNILTKREKEVSNLIRMGYSNKEIAIALKISISTVKAHIQKIYEKCGAKNRIHLINKLYIK